MRRKKNENSQIKQKIDEMDKQILKLVEDNNYIKQNNELREQEN